MYCWYRYGYTGRISHQKPWSVPITLPPNPTSIKKSILDTKKKRKIWNKENSTGNIVLKNKDKNSTIERNWSSLEHGIDKRIGKSDSLMIPSGEALVHPAASRLVEYAMDGCPVDCGKDWELSHIREAVRKGAHISALHPVARKVLREKTMEKVKEGFAKIEKCCDLLRDMPKSSKFPPLQ